VNLKCTQNVIKSEVPHQRWAALNTHSYTAGEGNATPLEGYTGTVEVNVGLPIIS